MKNKESNTQQDRGRNKLNTAQRVDTQTDITYTLPSLTPAEIFQYESQRELHPRVYHFYQTGLGRKWLEQRGEII